MPKIADVLRLLGLERAIVAHGHCDGSDRGLDEFSTASSTVYTELSDTHVTDGAYDPESAGPPRESDPAAFAGGDAEENARILRRIVCGQEKGTRMNLALLNAGAGLYVGGKADTIGFDEVHGFRVSWLLHRHHYRH